MEVWERLKIEGLRLTTARNTGLLAATQALNTLIVQVLVVYAPISILLLGGSPSLAGLGMAFVWGGRLVSTLQMGVLMDRVGRRPVIAGGMALAAVSLSIAALALSSYRLILFLSSLLLYGVARGMVEFTRVAVADLLPPERRGFGTGLLLTASIAGTLTAPLLIYSTSQLHPSIISNIVDSLNYTIIIAAAGIAVALMVWPEPLKLAKQLNNPGQARSTGLRMVANPAIMMAVLAAAASTGVMVAVMSLNTVVMYDHHYTAVEISTVVMIHVLGMYALSIPIGRLSDKYGRVALMTTGLGLEGAGTLMILVSDLFPVVATALFLVGLGWSAVWVSSSAYIADLTTPSERGGVTGFADAATAGSSIVIPFMSGIVLEVWGVPSLVAICTAITALAVAACYRLVRK
ncbi:MAG: MFS transporter [Candidatus Caldarchaeum sp.]